MGNTGRRVWTEGQDEVIEETIAANEDLRICEVGKLAKDALIEKYGEKAHFKKESINNRIGVARESSFSVLDQGIEALLILWLVVMSLGQHNGSISEYTECE